MAIVAAGPLLLFHFGSYHWFRLDEWAFLTQENGTGFPDLLEPHGAHWVAVPRTIYYGISRLFGITTYRPFQVPVVLTHLAIAVLLHAVIRRAGVRPWLAFASVALFVLAGPGAVNSVWGFQVGFNGSLAWGLGHLLLADHDGPPDRRDGFGIVCGLFAITSSAVGVTLIVGVAVAVLLRRGWRMAVLHGGPLLATYWVWTQFADVESTTGSPPWRSLPDWLRSSVTGTFEGLGRFTAVAWALAAVVVIGLVLLWRTRSRSDQSAVRARLASPLGLAAAALCFAATTFAGRWWTGAAGARADRYVYLGAALLLPLVAVSAEAIAARWRQAAPALVMLLLLPIPFNLARFDQGVYGERWMARREYVLRTAVRMPFAPDVPRDVRPMSTPFVDPVTIGFLLDATKRGDLDPSDVPMTPAVVDEFEVRLGVARRVHPGRPSDCRTHREPVVLQTEVGDVIHLGTGVSAAIFADGRPSSRRIGFPRAAGEDAQLTIELPGLDLWIGPLGAAETFRLCEEVTSGGKTGSR